MAITDEQCRQIFYRAQEVEVGIAVEVMPEDVYRTKNQLYAIKKELNITDFAIFEPEPIDGKTEIWIVKKSVELPNA